MTRRTLTSVAALGAALMVGVPTAWGSGDEPYRDHGDATQAKLDSQSATPLVIFRDHGDATQAKLDSQPATPLVIYRDHGDATQAKADAQSSTPVVIYRDHGDATQAKLVQQSAASVTTERLRLEGRPTGTTSPIQISSVDSGSQIEWPQVGAGLGIGIVLALGLGLLMRAVRVRPFAHR
jgi:hypothetical protein